MCNMEINTNALIYQKKYIENNVNFVNNDPSLIGPLSRWNNVGMIYRTKMCLKEGVDIVLKDPSSYFKIVKFNFISTHGHYSFDHGFKPENWNKFFGFLDLPKKINLQTF